MLAKISQTAPIPVPHASHSTTKGWVKSRRPRTGAVVRARLRLRNASWVESVHSNVSKVNN